MDEHLMDMMYMFAEHVMDEHKCCYDTMPHMMAFPPAYSSHTGTRTRTSPRTATSSRGTNTSRRIGRPKKTRGCDVLGLVNAERCPGCRRGGRDLCSNDSFSISDGAASSTSLRDGFLNRVVSKQFGGVMHRGVVIALARSSNTYLISYDDGDREEVSIAELSGMLIGHGRVPRSTPVHAVG